MEEMAIDDYDRENPHLIAQPTGGGSNSDRSSSPAPTLQSLTGSIYENLFDEKHGRRVNSTCATYSMAADSEEVSRMDNEHQMYKFIFKQLFGDELFIGPVERLLKDPTYDPGEQKRVMDLGTGTAAWAIDMANRFPDCDVIGIDLVPLQPGGGLLPDNCRIEVDNLNLPLDHYDNSAHLLHIRLISAGITDYPGLLDKCSRILRPGGLLHILETDFRPYSRPSPHSIMSSKSSSPTVKWLRMVMAAMHSKHANIDAAANLRKWIDGHRNLKEIEYRDVWLPIFDMYPDNGTEHDQLNNIVARQVQADFQAFMNNARPLMLDHRSPEEVDRIQGAALMEIKNPKHQVFIRVCILCARRV